MVTKSTLVRMMQPTATRLLRERTTAGLPSDSEAVAQLTIDHYRRALSLGALEEHVQAGLVAWLERQTDRASSA